MVCIIKTKICRNTNSMLAIIRIKTKKYDVVKKVFLCKELQDGLKFRIRQVLLNLDIME